MDPRSIYLPALYVNVLRFLVLFLFLCVTCSVCTYPGLLFCVPCYVCSYSSFIYRIFRFFSPEKVHKPKIHKNLPKYLGALCTTRIFRCPSDLWYEIRKSLSSFFSAGRLGPNFCQAFLGVGAAIGRPSRVKSIKWSMVQRNRGISEKTADLPDGKSR